ncbi:hypothetical protein KKG24_02210, partial [Patescibacteria group bacterium]|nr:hypothetical protein [Patescibacteria group bacterium]
LKTVTGVEGVRFKFPNLFDVGYSPEVTSKEQILSLDVFKTYKATIITEDGETGDIQLIDSTGQPQLSSNSGSCCGGSSGGGCGCGCGR